MNKFFVSLFCAYAIFCFTYAAESKPIPVIFDTDMGNDVDDALALCMLFTAEDMGLCKILCIAHNKDNLNSAVATDIVSKYYGRSPRICAVSPGTGVSRNDGWYLREVCEKKKSDGSFFYNRRLVAPISVPESVSTLRKILSEAEDSSVAYISVGFSTNLANLLKSGADGCSELAGRELVAKKVRYISIMAGDFSAESLENPKTSRCEFNIATDIDSARYVFDNCPVPMYFSGFEFGDSVRYPRSEIDAYFGEGNPVFDAYNASSLKVHGRNGKFDWATFDMTSVLFVLEPKLIKLSAPGKVSVIDGSGRVGFMPAKGGLHKYFLLPEDADKIKDRLVFFVRARKL